MNTKIGRYDVATGNWGFVHYPLEPEGGGDWIGLSELTALPNGAFAVIERDKGWGSTTGFNAELNAVFGIKLADAEFRAFDGAAKSSLARLSRREFHHHSLPRKRIRICG